MKRKSFWDWLWNFCIRARTSRRREGCTWRQYKAWNIEGRSPVRDLREPGTESDGGAR